MPLPLYCVDDVSKTLVDLRPEGAPTLKTVNFHHAHLMKAQCRMCYATGQDSNDELSAGDLDQDDEE